MIIKEVNSEEIFFHNSNGYAGCIYISIPDILCRTDGNTGELSRWIPPVDTYQIDGNRKRPSSLRFFWRYSPYLCEQGSIPCPEKRQPFPDGAVFVFDLIEAKSDDNAFIEGQRKFIGVMQKNSKMFSDTAGWGFEAFKNDSKERLVKDQKKECFNCHEAQKKNDYIFSGYRK